MNKLLSAAILGLTSATFAISAIAAPPSTHNDKTPPTQQMKKDPSPKQLNSKGKMHKKHDVKKKQSAKKAQAQKIQDNKKPLPAKQGQPVKSVNS